MKLIATMPVRNEAWVLGLSARVALMWCDELVILNHRSEDESVDIIADLQRENPGRVHLLSAPDPQWSEMQHREMMLDLARGKLATHIAIVDADEVLTGNLTDIWRRPLGTAESWQMLQLPGYNLRGGLHRYHINGTWGRRWFSTVFKDDERLYWARGPIGYDHHQREPKGMRLNPYQPISQGFGGIMHLWGVTERRLRAKHAFYKMSERLKFPDKPVADIDTMYSWWKTGCNPHQGEPNNWQFADVPDSWWLPYGSLMKYLNPDAEPFQERLCREMWTKHSPAAFAGLDLFGVV